MRLQGFAAIADHALTDTNGRHTTCFLMKLDHEALPSMDVAMEAIANTYHEVHSQARVSMRQLISIDYRKNICNWQNTAET